MKRLLVLLAVTLPVAGCYAGQYGPQYPPYGPHAPYPPQPDYPQYPPQPGPYPPTQYGCPIVGSQDWTAWVNAMPGPNAQPTLIATGRVTVPTGGYRFAWGDVRVMESYPVQVVAELQVIPPSGAATQAVVTHEMRGQWPMSSPVGSLEIRCGGQTLARISPVQNAY